MEFAGAVALITYGAGGTGGSTCSTSTATMSGRRSNPAWSMVGVEAEDSVPDRVDLHSLPPWEEKEVGLRRAVDAGSAPPGRRATQPQRLAFPEQHDFQQGPSMNETVPTTTGGRRCPGHRERDIAGPQPTQPARKSEQADQADQADQAEQCEPATMARGERFAAVMATVVRRLPFGLSRVVAPSFLGFTLINGLTFGVDLGLLTVFRGGLNWPLPLAITLAYLLAFGLSFLLNRSLNFRSHAPVGPQATIYLVAVGINYAAFILGVGDGLAELGLEYHLARITAGICEAVYMYIVLRWIVFRDSPQR
jgi:putative flippase GtrA